MPQAALVPALATLATKPYLSSALVARATTLLAFYLQLALPLYTSRSTLLASPVRAPSLLLLATNQSNCRFGDPKQLGSL